MGRWTEAVRYSVADLTKPENAGFAKPGFYWFIPLDGNQAQVGMPEDYDVHLVGPFATREEARDDAIAWIHSVLQAPDHANDDTHRRAA